MLDHPRSRRDFLALAGTTVLTAVPALTRARGETVAAGGRRSAYERAVLGSAPVGYWRLGEARGPVARDTSGRGNDGRYLGRPAFGQPGAIAADPDRAVGLDGPRSRSHVAVPGHPDFSVATSGRGLTVEVWMRPDVLDFPGETASAAGGFVHWLGKGAAGSYEWGFRFYGSRTGRPNRISAYVWNPDGKLGAGAYYEDRLAAGAWVYLVATFDDPRKPNARVQLYKDGVPSPHNDSPGTLYKNYGIRPRPGPAPLRLGTRDLRSFLTGGLDEVAVYPRVLAADEILRHWRAARERNDQPSRGPRMATVDRRPEPTPTTQRFPHGRPAPVTAFSSAA